MAYFVRSRSPRPLISIASAREPSAREPSAREPSGEGVEGRGSGTRLSGLPVSSYVWPRYRAIRQGLLEFLNTRVGYCGGLEEQSLQFFEANQFL